MVTRPNHGGNLTWAAAIAGCSPELLLDFSASINPLGPPSSAIAAISEGFKSLTTYPDPNYRSLKTILSSFHQVEPDCILPGNGAAELLTWAAWEMSQLKMAFVPSPGFGDYYRALRTFNAKIQTYFWDLNCWQKGNFSEMGIILNNPHNPTGKLFLREEIFPFLEQFKLVIIDEAFMDFLPPNEEQSLISYCEKYPNLVIIRSLTKFYSLPGLRLGYAISHPDILQKWQQLRDPWAVNSLAVFAAEAVIKDTNFQQQTWQWLRETRPKLYQELQVFSTLKPLQGSANFLLVETQESSIKLQEKLLQNARILIRDCLSFPELGDRYFRIAIKTISDNNYLIENLKLIIS